MLSLLNFLKNILCKLRFFVSVAASNGSLAIFATTLLVVQFFINLGKTSPYGDDAYLILFLAAFSVLTVCFNIFKVLPNLRNQNLRVYVILLFLSTICLILGLAQLDLQINAMFPKSFQGMGTSLDAVYFVVATISTAGSGEIYPLSQFAKLVMIFQMTLGYLLTAFILVKEVRQKI